MFFVMLLKIVAPVLLVFILLLGFGLINISGKCSREEEKANLEREMEKHEE